MGDIIIDYINYYYDLFPTSIYEENDKYIFYYNNQKYVLTKYNRDIDELEDLIKLNIDMLNKSNMSEIIISKYGPLLKYIDDTYILLKVYVPDKEITINDIYNFLSYKGSIDYKSLNRCDWSNLWSTKIDYFEYQMTHILKKYMLLNNTIDYYIGLSENALSYFKYIDVRYGNIGISHKRIGINSTLYDLYNPLNLIIDYRVRDISEYIKSAFFNDLDVIPLLRDVFRNYYFDKYNLSLLVSRLLFPSYYFDMYENIIVDDLDENIIQSIIKKSSSYEDFIHNLIINNELLNIRWIK